MSKKRLPLLGTALATAAMMLPSVQFASADAAPERGIISFKYLNYQEHQDALGTSVSPGTARSEHPELDDDIGDDGDDGDGDGPDGAVWMIFVRSISFDAGNAFCCYALKRLYDYRVNCS
jgi:hypothetical protein